MKKLVVAPFAAAVAGVALFIAASGSAQTTPLICTGPVDIDGLDIEIHSNNTDAIEIKTGCTGTIKNVNIDTWTNDGIKVKGDGGHDLLIENVTINCHDSQDGAHQDGVQAMSGHDITFLNLKVRCGLSNAQFFVSDADATNVICDNCNLGPDASHTANVWGATNGVRNSVLCKPETKRYFTKHGTAVDVNNVQAPAGDERCQ